MAAPPAPVAAPADPGLVLGRYRPLRPLGSGGSGSVWLARDETTSEDVALKAVRREGKAASRAEREVEAATRLRHPRCLRALALDRDDEHVYVAYEYVRGRTLRDTLRSGDLPDRAAVEATAQVLEGLAHAHSRGVVHRDVKPANVMLADDDDVSVRILDFGLAQMQEADTLTAAGDVPGTLAYVSPERLAGQPATGAADVWSAGVLLWEALAGWHPFAAASPVETARRIRDGARPLASVRPDLPTDLCTLVDRMLAVDPARRPPAKRLAHPLRDAFETRARRPRPATSLAVLRGTAVHAALAATFATGSALLLPFFPRGWPFVLGLLAGAASLRSPRAGLAVALAVPILPLGNVSLGLALLYGAAALAWLALFAGDPKSSLFAAATPLLALVAGAGALPVVAMRARGWLRRAALSVAGVIVAGIVAALTRWPLPLDGFSGAQLALAGKERPDDAARAVASLLAARPGVLVLAAVCALAAITALPARARGLWGVAAWGTGLLAAATLAPALAGDPPNGLLLAPGIWAGTLLLAAPLVREPVNRP